MDAVIIIKFNKNSVSAFLTRGSAVAVESGDVLCHLKSCQLLRNCTNNSKTDNIQLLKYKRTCDTQLTKQLS